MTNDPKYNLEERTTKFAEEIVRFTKKISHKPETLPLISQLVRAGTSIGANYCEADDASSKKDFLYKIGICRKEARESKYWLRIIVVAEPSLENESKVLWQEAKELHLIFAAICRRK